MAEKQLNLRQKLASVYKNIDFIEKAGDNKAQSYKYVRAADVLRNIRKAFADVGVYAETNFELLGTYDIKTNRGGTMHTATVKARIVFFDLDSDETKMVSGLGDGADSGDKGIYKAQTGAVKNALRNAFLVPDEADPEADQSVDEATAETFRGSAERTQTQEVVNDKNRFADNAKEDENFDATQQFDGAGAASQSISLPENKGPKPNDKQLAEYGNRIRALGEKLVAEGEFKASRGLPVNRKILKYLLFTTSAQDAKEVSIAQFDVFFDMTNKIEPKQLTKLIEDALKGEKAANV